MKIKWYIVVVVLLFTGTLFSSCEKTEYFKSESNVKSQLSGDWDLIPIPRTNPAELWKFSDGTLSRFHKNSEGHDTVDLGTYTVSTSLMKVQIKIDGMEPLTELNGTWDVVQLDKSILVMATDHSGTTGILEKDFSKR